MKHLFLVQLDTELRDEETLRTAIDFTLGIIQTGDGREIEPDAVTVVTLPQTWAKKLEGAL